ncbi:LpqN/LpqT family lipoprotein [Mycobacterium sp.]|uniref:LpqN/LpqT family lipoprotein n=1 Tax=Mycobacterium sp. TaxID=1785 RepID=UPI002CEF305B|nr:LpqN/LpqT family lipoprotein [Mycobacterium sp.]HTQ19758.1 LpqN/LpqT family lipoprotein [Mycobacterium sp.]
MKYLTAATISVVLSFVLVGCGSGNKSETKTSTSTSTVTSTTSPETSATPGAHKYTLADYVKDNNLTETQIHHGDPGSPTINLPTPAGWQTIKESNNAPYGGIVLSQPADTNDPPSIVGLLVKLTGNVDQAKLLEAAPGELQNLPGYQGGAGTASTLGGFKAWQLSGTYDKGGKKRAIAQKTVVIPGGDGVFVLQLNADAADTDQGPLMDAMKAIDEQTTITV